jgi:hypothetical protein
LGLQGNARKLLALLGGDLVRDVATDKWRTTTFEDAGDKFGILGDRLRIVAGWHLYRQDPSLRIVVLGGESNWTSDAPTVAMVMKHELIELGVPEQAIVTERGSFTTYQQLSSLQAMFEGEIPPHGRIVSNRYHLGRIQAFIEHAPALLRLRQWHMLGRVTLQEAEAILMARDPNTWQSQIDAAYQSPRMRERIALEEKGTRQIRDGTYLFE